LYKAPIWEDIEFHNFRHGTHFDAHNSTLPRLRLKSAMESSSPVCTVQRGSTVNSFYICVGHSLPSPSRVSLLSPLPRLLDVGYPVLIDYELQPSLVLVLTLLDPLNSPETHLAVIACALATLNPEIATQPTFHNPCSICLTCLASRPIWISLYASDLRVSWLRVALET
jgi:hypothetical protein